MIKLLSDLKIKVYSIEHEKCFEIDNIGNCLVTINNKKILQFRPYSKYFESKCKKANKFKDIVIKVCTGLVDVNMEDLYSEDVIAHVHTGKKYRINIDHELYGVFDFESGQYESMDNFVSEEEFMKLSDYDSTPYENQERVPF